MKNKSKSSSGSVKAPLTYDPGKGRPKEYLAYLNYQEMQALKRLNGNNMERGPRGLPSFPPADAIGSSSRASSTKKSGPSSSLNAPARTAPSASRTTTRGPAASMAAARQGSSISKGNVGTARQGSPVSKNPAGGGARDSGRATANTDRAFKQAAEQKRTSKALSNPALKQDAGRSAIGGISKDKSVGLADGSRIRGAIQGVKDLGIAGVPGVSRIGVPTATIKTPTARQFPSLPAGAPGGMSMYQPGKTSTETGAAIGNYVKSYEMAKLVKEAYPNIKESVDKVASMYNTLSVAMPGEAYVTKYGEEGIRDLSRVATNMLARNLKTDQVLSSMDTLGLRPGTEKFRLGEKAGGEGMGVVPTGSDYQSAAISEMGKGIRGIGVSPAALDATNFWAAGTPAPRGPAGDVPPVGKPVRGTQFGVDPIAREAVIRRNVAARDVLNPYVDPFRAAGAEKTIAERTSPAIIITPASATPERTAVPGLIQYTRLDRPMAPTAGRSAVIPTSRKPITDRIAPEYPRISSDPTMAGKDLTPRGKQIYDRIISESGDLPIGIDARQTLGVGVSGTGQISIPFSGVDASGSIAGSAGYSQDVIRDVYAGSVAPSKFRSATEAAASLPIAARTPSIPSMSGATSGISLLSPGVSLPSPPTMRGATSIASRFPVAAVTPSPSTMRSATDVASGFPAVNVVPSAQQSLYRGALPMGMSFTPGLPTQEKNLGVETLVDANIARNPYDVQRSAEAQTPESLVGSRQIKIDGIGTLSIEDALKTVPENKREAVRQELALAYEAGITNFSKQNFDSMVKGAEYDPNFDYSGLEAASEPDSTAVTPDGYLDPSEALPRNVSPEAQEVMRRQEKLDKTGVNVMKRAGPAGYLVLGADAGFKLFTGQGIAGNTAALKRQYMQSSPEQQAALERRYPNLTRFAKDVGLKPQLPMSNYTNWAEKSGLRGTPSREGGGPGGIASLGGGFRDDDQTGVSPTPDTPSTPSGRRPDIYYMWDLSVNIPSPSDPNYTQYQTYLAERLAAQQAMGFV